jgi:hypothetical protein
MKCWFKRRWKNNVLRLDNNNNNNINNDSSPRKRINLREVRHSLYLTSIITMEYWELMEAIQSNHFTVTIHDMQHPLSIWLSFFSNGSWRQSSFVYTLNQTHDQVSQKINKLCSKTNTCFF